MDMQQSERLRALWKSGRDKYRSFFTVLSEVRQEIGDDALPHYCIAELHIGISVITEVSKIMRGVDAEIIKDGLSSANKAEAARRGAEALAKRKAREALELEKAEHAKKLAEIRAEAAELAAKDERRKRYRKTSDEKSREKKDEENKKRYARHKAQKEAAKHGTPAPADLDGLAEQIRRGHELTILGTKNWVEGSIVLAKALCAARDVFPSNREFGEWLKESGRDFYNDHDRAALINLGREPTLMHKTLSGTESRSYKHIWQTCKAGYPSCPLGQDGNIVHFPQQTAS
jgi:hypothetical protein